MRGERSSGVCEDCGAPLAPDQRYCVACGERVASRSPQLVALLHRLTERSRASNQRELAATKTEPAVPAVPGAGSRASGLTLPPRKICALLVLVFLGFGVLLGNVASSPVSDTLASARAPVKIVLPSQVAAATNNSTTSTSSSSSSSSSSESAGASEPPEAQATPTPAAAAAPASAKTSTPAARRPPSKPSGGSPKKAAAGGSGKATAGVPYTQLPPIKHVFVIMLSDQPYAAAFGPSSTAPYLAQTLEHKGELLVHYDAVAHEDLADEVALLSGQGPTTETAANCATYASIVPTGTGPDEQVLGEGCVYPASTQTLAGQLTAKGLTWRAYVQGSDEGEPGAGACAHPALGQPDPTSGPTPAAGPFATFIDPFVYFQSITDSAACATDDVGMNGLRVDLADPSRTPNFSYIAPDRCHDGNPTPCRPGAPAGLASAEGFLTTVVPEIIGSKAYKESGLLVITTDEAPSSGEFADSSACCGQPRFPNVAPSPSAAGLSPRGGGAVGALLLSPFVKGATTNQEPFNHFSLLRTIEDFFGLKHLGYAALPGVKSFEPAMFTSP